MTKKIIVAVLAALLLICGFALAEECADGNHVHKVIESGSGTCADPMTITEVCAVCGKTLSGPTTIASDHVHTVEVKKATCSGDETIIESCKVCGKVLDTKVISGTAHGHTHAVRVEPATCVSAEKITEYCAECGEILDTATGAGINKNNHVNEIAVPGKEPTCTESGLTIGGMCTACGVTTDPQEVIPALGHTEIAIAGKEATCTEPGLSIGSKCTVCGEITEEQYVLSATGHEFVVRVVKPTTEKRGYNEITCELCDFYMRNKYTDKLGAETIDENEANRVNGLGTIVFDLEGEARDYTTHLDGEDTDTPCVCIEALFDGAVEARELHLSLDLIAEMKEQGFTQVCFHVGDAELILPFADLDTAEMELVKADFNEMATLTGYIVTLDPTFVDADGEPGIFATVEMSANTTDVDGIEMEITAMLTSVVVMDGEAIYDII